MQQQKWYLSVWFLALVFTFSFTVIPFFIGIILLALRIKEDKRNKQELELSGFGDIQKLQENIMNLETATLELEEKRDSMIEENKQLQADLEITLRSITDLNHLSELEKKRLEIRELINSLEKQAREKQDQIVVMDDEILYQSFGFYQPKYNLESSEEYKNTLELIREKQKKLVKDQKATHHSDNWQLDGSLSKGRTMNNNNIKLTLRAFNNECDTAISKVKFNNIESVEKRIRSAMDTLNKVNKHNKITITQQYLDLKLKELYLAYEYEQKKEEEREEQRRIKEQIREEQRVLQEIQKMKEKIEKEESHFNQALSKLHAQLSAAGDEKKADIEEKIKEIEAQLSLLEKSKENVLDREQNTRAGYVYVISNIGSFGENVYKIGMTRRLEPLDRVKELGDASIPFTFDVHAMIFSDDAPKLEAALHRSFHSQRLNRINERKEFFAVTLNEIEEVVRRNHNNTIEFTKIAEAQEYRQTLNLKSQSQPAS